MTSAFPDVAEAFSRKALVYDDFGRDHPNLRRMRRLVRLHVLSFLKEGDHILELNAGTGSDAAYFASLGYRVHATDLSPGMLSKIEEKIQRDHLQENLTAQMCSFTDLNQVSGGPYQYVFSNMGGVNCLQDLSQITRDLVGILAPGAHVTWVVMPPFCPWELTSALRGDLKTSFRRFSPAGVRANVEGVSFMTYYFTPRQVRQAFGPQFIPLRLQGLSVFTPPADHKAFARRFPRLYAGLSALDNHLTNRSPFNSWGDFFIMTLAYTPFTPYQRPPAALHPVKHPVEKLILSSKSRGALTGAATAERLPAMAQRFQFACPACRAPLVMASQQSYRCPNHGWVFNLQEGIWRFLTPERQAYFERFIKEYETIRQAEGRGSNDPAYYRALPFKDLTRRMASAWRIRSRSFQALSQHVLPAVEQANDLPPKTLDLGAGNTWLSYRLALRGHLVAPVDLLLNRADGLGAYVNYPVPLVPIQAEFDHLPLVEDQFDLVIFNASLHYSTSYETTLVEALRVLKSTGQLVIIDTPVYHHPASGEQMVRERQEQFQAQYGFPSDALASENFLTYDRLDKLGDRLAIDWKFIHPHYGLRWALKPWLALLRRSREPAQFVITVGQKRQG